MSKYAALKSGLFFNAKMPFFSSVIYMLGIFLAWAISIRVIKDVVRRAGSNNIFQLVGMRSDVYFVRDSFRKHTRCCYHDGWL